MEVCVNNEKIPVLELKHLISKEELEKIGALFETQSTIVCASQWETVPTIIKQKEIESAFFRRLERKGIGIEARLLELNQDALRLKLELVGKIIATKVNELPMIELINRISISILLGLTEEQRIALLLGVSGLIPDGFEDEYVYKLFKEAEYLMSKYNLYCMNKASWKFFGCRPPAYPTLRIVTFALIINDEILFHDFESESILLDWIEQKEINFPSFWKYHTHFNAVSYKKENTFSKELKALIITNYFIPYFYWRFSKINEIELLEKLISLAYLLPPEKNAKVQKFRKLGQKAKSIAETQGLLELLNDFCVNKQCLQCQIGVKLLN